MIIFSPGIPKNAPKFMALDTESGPEPDWCKDMKVPEWCTKPGATRICYVTCPMAEKDWFLARISKSGMNFFPPYMFYMQLHQNSHQTMFMKHLIFRQNYST